MLNLYGLESIINILLISEIPIYFFMILDILKLDFLKKYRINYSSDKKLRKYPDNKLIWKCFKIHLKNFVFCYLIPTYFLIYGAKKYGINPYRTDIVENIYDKIKIFAEVVIISFMSDFLFYWLHKLMHIPWFYKRFHYKHHQGLIYTFSLAHHVMDFYEAILFSLPQALPPLIINSHIISMQIAFFWTQLNTILGHSGYNFSLFRRFGFLDPIYHDTHHYKFNYNFGAVYPLMDKLFGTYHNPKLK